MLFLVLIGLTNVFACSNWLELLRQLIGSKPNNTVKNVLEKSKYYEDADYGDYGYWEGKEVESDAEFVPMLPEADKPDGKLRKTGILNQQHID